MTILDQRIQCQFRGYLFTENSYFDCRIVSWAHFIYRDTFVYSSFPHSNTKHPRAASGDAGTIEYQLKHMNRRVSLWGAFEEQTTSS